MLKNICSTVVNTVYKESLVYCLLLAPVVPYWYLIVLLWYYLIANWMVASSGYAKKLLWTVSILLGVFLPIFLPISNRTTEYLYRILYHFVFFMSGIYFEEIKQNKYIKKTIFGAAVLIILIGWYTGLKSELPGFRLVSAALIIYILQNFVEKYPHISKNRVMVYMGRSSIYIYVLHNYLTVAFRVIYQRIGFSMNAEIYVLLNIVGTIVICYMAEKIATHFWPLDIFFHPYKTIWRIKQIKEAN